MMKQLFGQLGMMAATSQPPIVNSQGNVQTSPDALVPPDRRSEELQEPILIASKEDEMVSKSQIENLISQKVKVAIASEAIKALVRKGHPYPAEYDQEKYPKGYIVPKFNLFDGTTNPHQHLTQFKATCGNTGGNDALLLHQFISSLTGTTFEWYADLPNDSVRTFVELETMFIKRFSSATKKVTIADLALEKRKREELVTKYITR
ncbi:uncharacterized protein LOC110111751 [Dendrobium catenatum]|uniref:uncharacterized protein LOC110111751 n=1 Tax=Dendrobium catenatum TaxID=906689 RepID=UPI0009F325DD|nr:uncharacterized protein LOC110111751 [Dendrobium catenatum]